MPDIKYHCEYCGETCSDDELRTLCVSRETRTDPAEYDAFCPTCNVNWEYMTQTES